MLLNHRLVTLATLLIGVSLMLVCSVSCGAGDRSGSAIASVNRDNLQRLANLYDRFQLGHRWKGPKSEAEFKEFINGLDDSTLTRMGVSKSEVDALFISERDGQPFKIKWGVQGASRGAPKPVVFEQMGVSGKRRVGFTGMKQEEVESDEYDQLLAGS